MREQNTRGIPHPEDFMCPLCKDIFQKPTTLCCGHTFCVFCLYRFIYQQEIVLESNAIPLPICPTCNSLILIPIRNLHYDITISNLIEKLRLKPAAEHPKIDLMEAGNSHQILVQITSTTSYPMPHCATSIEFETRFIQEILQADHAQSVCGQAVFTWKEFGQKQGITGSITQQFALPNKLYSYRAVLQGKQYVQILQQKQIEIPQRDSDMASNPFLRESVALNLLTVCRVQPIISRNIQPIENFNYFFSIYDRISVQGNFHTLRQIALQIEETQFQNRLYPQKMIYCALQILKFTQSERKKIVESFDDEVRLSKINQFLAKRAHLPLDQILNIKIPGNYSTCTVFFIIFLFLSFHHILG